MNNVIDKIEKFMSLYEKKEFTVKDVRDYFSFEELCVIISNNELRQLDALCKVCTRIYDMDNLFTREEVKPLFSDNKPKHVRLLQYLDDEEIIGFIKEGLDGVKLRKFITENEEFCDFTGLYKYLKKDESKIKLLEILTDNELKEQVLISLESDDLKLAYCKKIPLRSRAEVIATLKDKKKIEKNLNFLTMSKGTLISALDCDETKLIYFDKFFWLLNEDDKSQVIMSLSDENNIIQYLSVCSDSVKEIVLFDKCEVSVEGLDKILSTIRKQSSLVYCLSKVWNQPEIIRKYLKKINNNRCLDELIYSLNREMQNELENNFPNNQKDLDVKIKDNFDVMYDILMKISKKSDVISAMDNIWYYPTYDAKYEKLIDIYAKHYKLNKEHLLKMVSQFSLYVLKYIKNENIVKIINSDPEKFEVIMSIFSSKNLEMDSAGLNDIINAVLQRKFRINESDVLLTFTAILNSIEKNEKDVVDKKINEMLELINVNTVLASHNLTKESFVNKLMSKDIDAINCLHEITNKFVREKRNEYVKENLEATLDKVCDVTYDKNELMKYMIANYSIDLIINLFPKYPEKDFNQEKKLNEYYTKEEIELIKKPDLIWTIVKFKKHPQLYSKMPEEVAKNIANFNSVFEKSIASKNANSFSFHLKKKNYEYKKLNYEYLVSILVNLDIDKVCSVLKNDEQLYSKFLKIWEQYKIGCWNSNLGSVLNEVGISINPEIIANFIQYFGLMYSNLEQQMNEGKISNISITALFDAAGCYSLESKKYSLLFGDENFQFIVNNPHPNPGFMKKEQRIEEAQKDLKKMRKRTHITIPPIDKDYILSSGKKIRVVAGNVSNPINLTLGERTGACMRNGGAGESLYKFCLEDDNGFHIRFHDPDTGVFISRVSGFRNGNTVFLNQLCESVHKKYSDAELIEVCKSLAKDLVDKSLDSEFPIENVVISPVCVMEKSDMQPQILRVEDIHSGQRDCYTDIVSHVITLATSAKHNIFVDFKPDANVPRYEALRDKKEVLYFQQCEYQIAYIQSLDQFLDGVQIENIVVNVPEDSVCCFSGEDWYIAVSKDGKISHYIMKNSNNPVKALNEMEESMQFIKENLNSQILLSDETLTQRR